jgi:hypothetical protein
LVGIDGVFFTTLGGVDDVFSRASSHIAADALRILVELPFLLL